MKPDGMRQVHRHTALSLIDTGAGRCSHPSRMLELDIEYKACLS